ncbi:MAG: YgiQ family radical SAM protein [Polyangiaceae bacterium]|nr:YgiQ family radical SAM protein [Polyangiaceae bacterium]
MTHRTEDLRAFLPTSRAELALRGWDEIDVLVVSGDAYVDHPAFGPVLVARFLEGRGYRVGFIAQPRWDSLDDVSRLGRPRLFVGVSAGNLDSMLNKLTAQKKVRSDDQYSPGGRTGMRPNRASIVYGNLCRAAFPGLPIVLGGIEASLRRIAHYDFWQDAVRRSVLLDAKADVLVFGMGELAAGEIADRLARGASLADLRDIRGTAHPLEAPRAWAPYLEQATESPRRDGVVVLPSYEAVRDSPTEFARMTRLFQAETNPENARPLLQVHGEQAVFYLPPARPLAEAEMDELYALPFVRRPHPSYGDQRIAAFESVRRSIAATRGCFGGCTFCSIAAHEGRRVQSRSAESVLREVRTLRQAEGFDGTVTDVGGPTANMYSLRCREPAVEAACRRPSCLFPTICRHLDTDQRRFAGLLRLVRSEPGIQHVYVASGIRCDLAERCPELIREIAAHHTGGQLSVAPEHIDPTVLRLMRKPDAASFERFARAFAAASAAAGKEQYLVPYLIVGHPGSTVQDTIALALYLKKRGLRPRQVQEFIPTPMAVATAMYHTGLDPFSGGAIPVVRDPREKRALKALLFYYDPQHHPLAREALRRAQRTDLIGAGVDCLVPMGDQRASPGGRPSPSRGRGRPRGPARVLRSRNR